MGKSAKTKKRQNVRIESNIKSNTISTSGQHQGNDFKKQLLNLRQRNAGKKTIKTKPEVQEIRLAPPLLSITRNDEREEELKQSEVSIFQTIDSYLPTTLDQQSKTTSANRFSLLDDDDGSNIELAAPILQIKENQDYCYS